MPMFCSVMVVMKIGVINVLKQRNLTTFRDVNFVILIENKLINIVLILLGKKRDNRCCKDCVLIKAEEIEKRARNAPKFRFNRHRNKWVKVRRPTHKYRSNMTRRKQSKRRVVKQKTIEDEIEEMGLVDEGIVSGKCKSCQRAFSGFSLPSHHPAGKPHL